MFSVVNMVQVYFFIRQRRFKFYNAMYNVFLIRRIAIAVTGRRRMVCEWRRSKVARNNRGRWILFFLWAFFSYFQVIALVFESARRVDTDGRPLFWSSRYQIVMFLHSNVTPVGRFLARAVYSSSNIPRKRRTNGQNVRIRVCPCLRHTVHTTSIGPTPKIDFRT